MSIWGENGIRSRLGQSITVVGIVPWPCWRQPAATVMVN